MTANPPKHVLVCTLIAPDVHHPPPFRSTATCPSAPLSRHHGVWTPAVRACAAADTVLGISFHAS